LNADPSAIFPNLTEKLNDDEIVKKSQTDLAEWQKDSDKDFIPDKDDKEYGDLFQMVIKNNIPQILTGLGSIDSVVNAITSGVDQLLSTI